MRIANGVKLSTDFRHCRQRTEEEDLAVTLAEHARSYVATMRYREQGSPEWQETTAYVVESPGWVRPPF